jgi:hypothetical protein
LLQGRSGSSANMASRDGRSGGRNSHGRGGRDNGGC